jgi:hypothetical protein
MWEDTLGRDLGIFVNNHEYSDIEILCKDEEILYGYKPILTGRSAVFNKLLCSDETKAIYEKQIFFPLINSSEMKIILQYICTETIQEESLIKDNIIEIYSAANYFQLSKLMEIIMKIIKITYEKNRSTNYLPELLSKLMDKTLQLSEEEENLLNLLVEKVATIPLNDIEFGRLSIKALKCLLLRTYEKETPFVTPEYEVFRYSAILAAKQVSNDAYKTLMDQLPTLKQIENSVQVENKVIPDNQEVAKELEPCIEYIDFRRIKSHIDRIEPLKIISNQMIQRINGELGKSDYSDLNSIRGIPIYRISDIFWDESACGSNLIIKENGKVISALNNVCSSHTNVRVNMILENKSIFEWDVVIEEASSYTWVGVCASENFDYERFAGFQSTGWVLGSNGDCYNSKNCAVNYCPPFGNDTKITVHLDMIKRTCAFTVNNIKYPEVSKWDNLPSKLYPVVSLYSSGRCRI